MSPSRPQVDCSELRLLHKPTRLASSALGITLKPRQAGGQGTKGTLSSSENGGHFFLISWREEE